MNDYNEQWDELARRTLQQEYTRLGVMPGDHLGYFLARLDEMDRTCIASTSLTPLTSELKE